MIFHCPIVLSFNTMFSCVVPKPYWLEATHARLMQRGIRCRRAGGNLGNRHRETDLRNFPPKVQVAIHPLTMLRSDAIKSVGCYNENYPYAEDYEMYLRISQVGKFMFVDDCILEYREHGGNASFKQLVGTEKSAARAERESVKNARERLGKNLRLSEATFDAYVAIRIIRRNLDIDKYVGLNEFLQVLLQIAKGVLRSELYTTGRLLMLLTFHGMRSASKSWIKKSSMGRPRGDNRGPTSIARF